MKFSRAISRVRWFKTELNWWYLSLSNSPPVLEPEGSSMCSKEPATLDSILTNYTEQNPEEADSYSSSQKFPPLMETKFYYTVYIRAHHWILSWSSPWSSVLLKKPTVAQLVKSSVSYGTRKFFVFTRACHWLLSQPIPETESSWRSW